MRCTCLESTESICNGTARIVMEMAFNITAHNASQCSHEVVNLSGVRTANSVCNADTVDANLVDGAVDAQEVDKIGTE